MGGAGRRGELASGAAPSDPHGPQPLPNSSSDSGSEGEPSANRIRIPRHKRPLPDIDTWFDYWSEEVVIAYHVLIDQCQQQGYAFLENCDITKFVEFVYENSSKFPPPC